MNNIDIASWGEFRIGTLFDIHPTKSYKIMVKILLLLIQVLIMVLEVIPINQQQKKEI